MSPCVRNGNEYIHCSKGTAKYLLRFLLFCTKFPFFVTKSYCKTGNDMLICKVIKCLIMRKCRILQNWNTLFRIHPVPRFARTSRRHGRSHPSPMRSPARCVLTRGHRIFAKMRRQPLMGELSVRSAFPPLVSIPGGSNLSIPAVRPMPVDLPPDENRILL